MQSQELISSLYQTWAGKPPKHVEPLPPSGSYRQYFRLFDHSNNSVIGVYNEDIKENKAFIGFTKHFLSKSLPVSHILYESPDMKMYLLDDLGDTTLLDFLTEEQQHDSEIITENIRRKYQSIIEQLILFQTEGSKGFDYSICYPRAAFDRQSMMWDLNYFKYYFLKLARIGFDEQAMENDFQALCDYLLSADCNFFLYRDFQSRNIMLAGDSKSPYFIDYQGGRKGALYYDIASLLFEAKADLPSAFRQEMLEYYMVQLAKSMSVETQVFKQYYYGYAYIRTMQAMGAYGFRGLYEKKPLFLQSIPPALKVLDWLTTNVQLPIELPELYRTWRCLIESEYIRQLATS